MSNTAQRGNSCHRLLQLSATTAGCLLLAALLANPATVQAVDDAIALTPPMGWNLWNKSQGNINEGIIRQPAGTTAKPLDVEVRAMMRSSFV